MVLSRLPTLDMVQQARLDMQLHDDALARNTFGRQGQFLKSDQSWKKKFIDIVRGEERSPEVIRQTINNIGRDLDTHRGRAESEKTGSADWHKAWIAVYGGWLEKLHQILKEIDGTSKNAVAY